MFGLNKEQFLGFLRHVITFIGALLLTKGNLDPGTVESISGAIVTIAGVLWSLFALEKQPMSADKVVATLGPARVAAVEKIIAAPSPVVRSTGEVGSGSNPR